MISFTMKRNICEQAEQVFEYVQQIGGRLEIHSSTYEFYVPVNYREFMWLKFPFLNAVEYVM